MIRLVASGAAGQPSRWILAFHRTTDSRLVRLLACGVYKHVTAIAYIREVDHWVFLDWRFATIDVIVARGSEADRLMAYYTANSDVLGIEPREVRCGFRVGWWCVPVIKHLIGIRGGALRPDSLWRDCIRQGAEIISHEQCTEPARHPGRPDASPAEAAG